MASENRSYAELLSSYEADILSFLRTFETIQENLKIGEVRPSQAELVAAAGDLFRRFNADFAPLTPPEDRVEFHKDFVIAIAHLERSFNLFMTAPGQSWTLMFLHSRSSLVRGLYALYDLRATLPTIARYFALEGAAIAADQSVDGNNSVAVGFTHREREGPRGEYSL